MPRKKESPTHSSGMYCYRIRCKHADGTTYQKPFYSSKSKSDAIKMAEQWKLEQEIVKKTGIIPSDIKGEPFSRWARKWLEAYKKGTVKEHTYNFTYRSNVEKYLIPYFGDTPLPDIMQVDLQKYIKEVRQVGGKPLAESTLQKHIVILDGIFERALENNLVSKNPVKNLVIPADAPKAPEREYWTETQMEQALQWCYGHPRTEGIIIMLHTGVRRSELMGLRWEDLDVKRKLLHVSRAVVPTTGAIVEAGPKTAASNRFIPLDNGFLLWLLALKRKSAYIIPGRSRDKPRSPNGWSKTFRKIMAQLAEETGLPILTPHELRHTFGTTLRERGVDIYTISRVMGHASVDITEKIYVHNDITVLRQQMMLDDALENQIGTA